MPVQKKSGQSMIFFCKFSVNPDAWRLEGKKKLEEIGGGNYKIIDVYSIIIEYTGNHENWSKLLHKNGFVEGPQIEFRAGKNNRLAGIVMKSSLAQLPEPIIFGNFEISFISDKGV